MTNLDALKKITYIHDRFIEEAALPPAHTGRGDRTEGGAYRFFHSGWWTAILCAIVSVTVLFGIIMAGRQDPGFVTPAGTETDSAEGTDTQADIQTEPAVKIDFEVEVTPSVVQAGESVTVTVKATFTPQLELVPVFNVCFTYGTVSVSQEILAYSPEETGDPLTVTIPVNAPVGEYDLTVECAGFEQVEIYEGALTVTEREDRTENPYVWITSDIGTVYPFQFGNGGRYVHTYNPEYYEKPWGYLFADGVLYFGDYSHDTRDLPTVVLHESLSFHYAETVYGNKTVSVYDATEEFVTSFHVDEFMTQMRLLPSGIYYCSFRGNYLDADRYEDAMNAAKEFDDFYGGEPYEQPLVEEEYQKDPNAFRDWVYSEHLIRIIIP